MCLLKKKNRRFAIIVTYKNSINLPYKTFSHRYKIIAWIKALWYTRFSWRFFKYECNEQELVELTFEQFKSNVLFYADYQRPISWRRGQAVFNYINSKYLNLANQIEHFEGVDCFYNDELIDQFISLSWKRLCNGF